MSQVHPALRIDSEQGRDAYVIRVGGDLALAGCPALISALADAERSQADQIVVDLEQLTCIDSGGLQALLRASRRSASNGSRLRLTRGRGEVARLLSLTLIDVTLPFVEPVGESLSGEILRLQEEACLARRRLHSYEARAYGPQVTDPAFLGRLERASVLAENRLRGANPAAPREREQFWE